MFYTGRNKTCASAILSGLVILSLLYPYVAEAKIFVDGVPFKSQVPPGSWSKTRNCGQTSSLMVFDYYDGMEANTQNIKKIDDWLYLKYGDPIRGYSGSYTNITKLKTLAQEFAGFSDSQGYYRKSLNDLKAILKEGKPVVIATHIRMNPLMGGHFMVLIGVDDKYIYVNDPGKTHGTNNKYSLSQFDRSWKGQGRSYLVIHEDYSGIPPDTTPPTPPSHIRFSSEISGKTFTYDRTPTFIWNESTDDSGILRYHIRIQEIEPEKIYYTDKEVFTYPDPLDFGFYHIAIKAEDNNENLSEEAIFEFEIAIGPSLSDPWPMRFHDQYHKGRSDYYIGAENGTVREFFDIYPDTFTSDMVADENGVIYVGTESNKILAINPDATIKWSIDIEGEVWEYPALINNGTLIAGTRNGYVYSINKEDGSIAWDHYFSYGGYGYKSPIVASKNRIYIVGNRPPLSYTAGRLIALDYDGNTLWTYNFTASHVNSVPAVDNEGIVYVNYRSSPYLYAINPDGSMEWYYKNQYNEWFSGSLLITGPQEIVIAVRDKIVDGVFVPSKLICINRLGNKKWEVSTKTGRPITSPPAEAKDGTLYLGGETEVNSFYAINPDGIIKWIFHAQEGQYDYLGWSTYPVVDKAGTIYILATDNQRRKYKVYALDPDGTQKWVTEEIQPDIINSFVLLSSPIIYYDHSLIMRDKDTVYKVE